MVVWQINKNKNQASVLTTTMKKLKINIYKKSLPEHPSHGHGHMIPKKDFGSDLFALSNVVSPMQFWQGLAFRRRPELRRTTQEVARHRERLRGRAREGDRKSPLTLWNPEIYPRGREGGGSRDHRGPPANSRLPGR